jgi:hypothetical protein
MKVKIGAHDIEIKHAELGDDNAQFDWNTNTITISSSLPPDQVFAGFIHESLHGCNSTLGSDTLGHALLDSLAEQIAQILWDNGVVDKEWLNRLTNKE